MEVGARIRALRESRGLSRSALARSIGRSEDYLYKVETGRRQPSLAVIEDLARALDADAARLLGDPPTSGLAHLTGQLQEFVARENNVPYLEVVWAAARQGIPTDALEDLVRSLARVRRTRRDN